jgi:metallo-beta-lactamase family protein
LGRRLVERQPTIEVFGDEIPLRASVEIINGYSAHADRTELREWIHAVRGSDKAPKVFLVHGEPSAQDELATVLRGDGFDTEVPEPMTVARI